MNEAIARDVVLTHAVESTRPTVSPELWSDADRDWASDEAARGVGASAEREAFIAARAALAARRLIERAPAFETLTQALRWRPLYGIGLVVVALLAGVLTDAIGATGRVNLLAAPLLGVLAWNLFVYALLLVRRRPAPSWLPARLRHWLVRHADATIDSAGASNRQALANFAADWSKLTLPVFTAQAMRALHLAAAAFALGALASIYLRGLAFEYRAGWDSTFLAPNQVHAILAFVLGPASRLTGIAIADAERLAQLRFSLGPGENAAPWIHLYAMTILLVIIVPRLLLAFRAARLARARGAALRVPLESTYFDALVLQQRNEAARVHLVPYAMRIDLGALEPLRAALAAALGHRIAISLGPIVEFGAEDELDAEVLLSSAVAPAEVGESAMISESADVIDAAPAHRPPSGQDAWSNPAHRRLDAAAPEYGGAPQALRPVPRGAQPAHTVVVALFALSATPESEHHGVFVERLAALLPAGTRLAVAIDERAFVERFGAAHERVEQRRAAWRKALGERAGAAIFIANQP